MLLMLLMRSFPTVLRNRRRQEGEARLTVEEAFYCTSEVQRSIIHVQMSTFGPKKKGFFLLLW